MPERFELTDELSVDLPEEDEDAGLLPYQIPPLGAQFRWTGLHDGLIDNKDPDVHHLYNEELPDTDTVLTVVEVHPGSTVARQLPYFVLRGICQDGHQRDILIFEQFEYLYAIERIN